MTFLSTYVATKITSEHQLILHTQDIEDDLVRGFSVVLPRIMQRLLYTLSYDRKVS